MSFLILKWKEAELFTWSRFFIVAITMNLLAVHLISWRPSNSEARIITKALKCVEA